ncbi:MAG: hypothetical protein ACYCPR_06085 [Thermoplasmataceae archaeon]
MNRKIMILMVAVVATVLPAVAVADVMITGSVQGLGHSTTDAFIVQPGSNYAQAHSTAGFTWTSSAVNESEDLGNITLGVMSNETIFMINVLDINFTQTGYFNLTVTVPYSNGVTFPTDTAMYFSTSPLTMTTLTSGDGVHSVLLYNSNTPGGHTINFGQVTSSTHIYIGFVVGAGSPANGSFNLAMSFNA